MPSDKVKFLKDPEHVKKNVMESLSVEDLLRDVLSSCSNRNLGTMWPLVIYGQ